MTPESVFEEIPKAPYSITYDIDWSPYAGGEDLLFTQHLLERAADWTLGPRQKALFRFNELLLVWLPLNYEEMIVQHEIFGHGYRIRSLSHSRAHVVGYDLGIPLPFGVGGGATSFTTTEAITSTQMASIAIAGVEATAILGNLTAFKWVIAKSVDPKTVFLYLLTRYDLGMYAWSLKDESHVGIDISGHDLNDYITWLNLTYPDRFLGAGRVRSLTWVSAIDPFSYLSLYSLVRYVANGKEGPLPMIPLTQEVSWLFGTRMGLTPFGPEFFWEHYLRISGELLYAYVKAGRHAINNYIGVGAFTPTLFDHDLWRIGFRADLWIQPKLLLEEGASSLDTLNALPLYGYDARHESMWGGSGSLLFTFDYMEEGSATAEFGYKSEGFLPGYALQAFPTLRFSLNFRF